MRKRLPAESRVWLIGGGIASLAAAVFLIRDGGVRGEQIRILEESGVAGGSLDGSGDVEDGYLIRGGRMFEPHFECTHDLLRSIPSLASPGKSVSEEILEFTERVVPSSRCRLVSNGQRMEAPAFELSTRDRLELARLSSKDEASLGNSRIDEYF